MRLGEYPPFEAPDGLSTEIPSNWNESTARRYFIWLTSSVDARVDHLLGFVGDESSADTSSLLDSVGPRALWALRNSQFTTRRQDVVELTNAGRALGADLGLLVAQRLLLLPGVKWEILRKPKTEVSFNQPVLRGFGLVNFNPILGGVPEALRAVRTDDATVWRRMYDHWAKLAINSQQGRNSECGP